MWQALCWALSSGDEKWLSPQAFPGGEGPREVRHRRRLRGECGVDRTQCDVLDVRLPVTAQSPVCLVLFIPAASPVPSQSLVVSVHRASHGDSFLHIFSLGRSFPEPSVLSSSELEAPCANP